MHAKQRRDMQVVADTEKVKCMHATTAERLKTRGVAHYWHVGMQAGRQAVTQIVGIIF